MATLPRESGMSFAPSANAAARAAGEWPGSSKLGQVSAGATMHQVPSEVALFSQINAPSSAPVRGREKWQLVHTFPANLAEEVCGSWFVVREWLMVVFVDIFCLLEIPNSKF